MIILSFGCRNHKEKTRENVFAALLRHAGIENEQARCKPVQFIIENSGAGKSTRCRVIGHMKQACASIPYLPFIFRKAVCGSPDRFPGPESREG
jgi:hypothetical protein